MVSHTMNMLRVLVVAIFVALLPTASYAGRFTIKCTEKTSPQYTVQMLFNKPNIEESDIIRAFWDAGIIVLLGPRPTLWTIDEEKMTVSAEGLVDLTLAMVSAEEIYARFSSPDYSLTTHFSLTRFDGKLKLYTMLSESRAASWKKKNIGTLPTYWQWTMECVLAKRII